MSDSRFDMRKHFYNAWCRRQYPNRLSEFDRTIVDVINQHPEYQTLFEDPANLDNDYRTDNNPFLHLSLHLGLHDQLVTNRPQGIREIYQKLYDKYQDEHQAQHLIMEIMAEQVYAAGRSQKLPDERDYLEQLKKLT